MDAKIADLVRENSSTTGTGTLTLTADSRYGRFSDAFAVGDLVYYAIRNNDNIEYGIGTIGASNTLARTTPLVTVVSGVYDDTAPSAITLSGTSIVTCPAGSKAVQSSAHKKNLITNGSAPYVQQEGAITNAANGDYVADVFRFVKSTSGTVNLNVFTVNTRDYIGINVSAVDTSIAAADIASLEARVEGYDAAVLRISQSDAKRGTLSFYSCHFKTGTYCIYFQNSARTRSYVVEYTQSVSNARELQEITLEFDSPTGTWLTDEGIGLIVGFTHMCGSTYHGTADAWATSDIRATSNQVNGMDNTNNVFRIGDIQLEVGDVRTEIEFESYSEKFHRVQRYYAELYATEFSGLVDSSIAIAITTLLPNVMRVAPTVLLTNTSPNFRVAGAVVSGSSSSLVSSFSSPIGIYMSINGFTSLTAGEGVVGRSGNKIASADARL